MNNLSALSTAAALTIVASILVLTSLGAYSVITISPPPSSITSSLDSKTGSSASTLSSVSGGKTTCEAPCVLGRVTIGPLCPVEQAITTATGNKTVTTAGCTNSVFNFSYSNFSLIFSSISSAYVSNNSNVIPLNADGTFESRIPSGPWNVTMTNCDYMGCSRTFPETVFVTLNNATILNISIDTGIR
ncbi:MAG: hypothetical protein ACRDF4_07715 [Rhabdochlamydiaceae bacterium]